MKLHIEIQMDNAAFDEDAGAEVARILRKFADTAERYPGMNLWGDNSLRDVNGNTVGKAEVRP